MHMMHMYDMCMHVHVCVICMCVMLYMCVIYDICMWCYI